MNIVKEKLMKRRINKEAEKFKKQDKIEVNILNKYNNLYLDNCLCFNDGREGINSIPFYYCDALEMEEGNPAFYYDEKVGKFYIPLKSGKKLYITSWIRDSIIHCMEMYKEAKNASR